MIVELKSLLPLTNGTAQEQEKDIVPLFSGALPTESLFRRSAPDAAEPLSFSPNEAPAQAPEFPVESHQSSAAALQEGNNRIADLLTQLLTVSERNADSSDRIADLLEQQNSDTGALYN